MKTKRSYTPCVNCGINTHRFLNTKRLVVEECKSFRQLLSGWTCKELQDDDVLCNNCCQLVNESLETNNKLRKFGSRSICLSCGISILRSRIHAYITDNHEHKLVLVQWVQPHQVKRLQHVCHSCYLRTDRIVRRGRNIKQSIIDTEEKSTDQNDPITKDPHDERETLQQLTPNQTTTITMSTYKRASGTARRCIFKHCNQPEKFCIPNVLRKRLLIDFSLYIPIVARICNKHLNNTHNEWSNLVNAQNYSEFNADQIEDLLSLLKSSTEGYYSNDTFQSIIRRDDVMCKYWLGVSYKEFEDMLEAVQPIKVTLKFPTKSMAMYLMKCHLGLTDKKVATFFQVSISLLNKIFSIMHKYLENKVGNCDRLPSVSCN